MKVILIHGTKYITYFQVNTLERIESNTFPDLVSIIIVLSRTRRSRKVDITSSIRDFVILYLFNLLPAVMTNFMTKNIFSGNLQHM